MKETSPREEIATQQNMDATPPPAESASDVFAPAPDRQPVPRPTISSRAAGVLVKGLSLLPTRSMRDTTTKKQFPDRGDAAAKEESPFSHLSRDSDADGTALHGRARRSGRGSLDELHEAPDRKKRLKLNLRESVDTVRRAARRGQPRDVRVEEKDEDDYYCATGIRNMVRENLFGVTLVRRKSRR